MKIKKLLSGITSLALSLTAFAGLNPSSPENLTANAAQANWKFDFGGSGAASGYTGVSASDGYSSSKGYGFAETANVANVAAGGSGAYSDAVQFKSTAASNTFNVDLPNGLYQVKVVTGNVTRTTIKMENMLQMINLTGNNAEETIQIPVTDGQLNIQAAEGRSGTAFSISAVEITQLNTTGEMKPTIWLCGDSTVANYYNVSDTAQHGWGQYLNKYIDTSKWEVRNMAASGQYAKGFVDGGQFTPIEYYGKEGDIYVISIGINDTNYSNSTEYYEVVTDMVKRAKAKGMTVVLVKQQGRRGDLERSPLLSGRWFGGQLDTIGSEQNVTVIDLFNPWQDFGLSVGAEGMKEYYAIQASGSNDDLHQSMKGSLKLAELMSQLYDFDSAGITAADMDVNVSYSFKNVNSGLYMEVEGGSAKSGANVQQWGMETPAAHNVWNLKAADDGYYYICSALDESLVLDVAGAKAANGQNVDIYNFNGNANQQFMFTKNSDGSYKIRTKISDNKSAVEIVNAETAAGANVQQWEVNGANCQDWVAETVVLPIDGRIVKGMTVLDSANAASWGIADGAKSGIKLFGDRDFTVVSLPDPLVGTEQIITACDSKNTLGSDMAQFTAASDAVVYVAMDSRVETIPSWLGQYKATGETLTTSNDVTMNIYSKEVKAGEKITLGDNGTNYNCINYTVFVGAAAPAATQPPVTEPPVTTPSATTPADEQKILLGDANCDGIVDIADATLILQYIGNGDKYKLSAAGEINADVTGGGDGVTALDSLFIQMVDAGIEKLPVYVPPVTTAQPITTKATTTTTDPRYFAADQTWSNGVTETVNAGYTREDGYVNLDNELDSSITFTVNVDIDGNYMTHIRFANGSANDRKMKVYVNGNTTDYWMQSFTGTGAWNEWTEFGIVLPLKAGKNTIQLVSATAEGGPNLDYITLTLTDEPYAETYDPAQDLPPVSNDKPTVYIAGDSTVQSYRASYAPQQGWGYYLQNFFDDNVTVVNNSIAGRSTKKFYDEGRWQSIVDNLKEGDFVMIQFAINDSGASNADRYAPTCGNVDNPTEGSYEWYMTEFINTAKAKGATPILVTTVIGMKAYSGGKFVNSYSNYCDACKKLAAKYGVPCIDLNTLMVDHYNSVGYDTAKSYHLMGAVEGSTDGTHFCEKGAEIVAGLVANAIKTQNIAGLGNHVK
ncbi:MAG: RICIN domain-containing protein [Alistipes sp.]|nr:RICIN domain-containing protein [Alistipes sp.]